MGRTKIEWANYEGEDVFVKNISKDDYESEYKGKLTCIHGCEARIRFTERKNGIKYFSTWNGEGGRHKETCEFHVNYKGKMGRKRLEGLYRNVEISDERIMDSLKRKYNDLTRKYKRTSNNRERSTKEIENLGEEVVDVDIYSDGEAKDTDKESRTNITSIDANHINSTYIDTRKNVIGKVKNVTINKADVDNYGYLNLKTDFYDVAVYFPEAFFRNEDGINLEEFNVLKDLLNKACDEGKELLVVCYGTIKNKKKSKKEFNINIISKKHILINGKSLNQIILNK